MPVSADAGVGFDRVLVSFYAVFGGTSQRGGVCPLLNVLT